MNSNPSSTFTWALDTPKRTTKKAPKETLLISDTTGIESDIFQFLLDSPELSFDTKLNNNSQSSSSDSFSSGEEGGKLSPKEASLSYATSRLDFRHKYDNLSDSQLKAMSSKERRQLRNKISARNFRNRRKEYVGTLEAELDKQKAENNRLKLDLSWLQTKVEKLTSENEQLKLDIALGSVVQPTLQDADWELAFPELPPEPNSLHSIFQPNTFISQAVVPSWDSVFIHKETQASDSHPLMNQYPLLAPALMSIILNHTMSMSTDQLLASAQLSTPSPTHPKQPTDLWDLLGPLAEQKEKTPLLLTESEQTPEESLESAQPAIETLEPHQESQEEQPPAYFCPIAWLHSTLCQHICQIVSRSIPAPPPVPVEKQTFLCRSYMKAVRYITTEGLCK